MTDTPELDADARAAALDPERSFIVQAPAGSGKTGLLIQRTLTLLTRVDHPEEVLAITFTRKAAAEMRERLLHALAAANEEPPAADYERVTWERARAVVARDEKLGWGLTLNPSRLRIMTIDALCASLVSQMPVLSRFGAVLDVVPRPDALYLRAARRLLGALEDQSFVHDDLQTLLQHLDNHQSRIESLLVGMLRHRDRWLPLVAGTQRSDLTREALQDTLRFSIERSLRMVSEALPVAVADVLIDVVSEAAVHCKEGRLMVACTGMDAVPSPRIEHRALWEGIADFVLKKDDDVRRSVTVSDGIFAPSKGKDAGEKALLKEKKERAVKLLADIGDAPLFVRALAELRRLPPDRYTDTDWALLQSLVKLLPVAAAELKLLFQERGQVDFTEQSHRALAALGSELEPTDLALALDYRIAHLLVDEFQDTSRTQFEMIERLVSGWQQSDGRTLFLVGDPMQSIYRFRDAEVGLFLHARAHGLGDVTLQSLALNANFRSGSHLVARNNEVFEQIFPARESIEDSAVCYAPAIGRRGDGGHLTTHAFFDASGVAEANRVVELVREARAANPQASIAILVRTRTHLVEILPRLAAADLRFHAVDIQRLATSPVVVDLWSLTRALLHLGDRTAWLALLRAPWCGLTLEDLYAVAGGKAHLTVWELIINEGRREPLSQDGRQRLARFKGVLANALAEKGQRDLRRFVEGTWLALGGPACVAGKADMDNAATYFDLLESLEDAGSFDSIEDLGRAMNDLFADTSADEDAAISIMTIHKAKGLEFDTVIIPGLHRAGRPDDRALLQWLELNDESGQTRRLLAPINASEADDPIGRYVAHVQKKRDRSEQLRLLYVAATRARESLHLLAQLKRDRDDAPRAPAANTLAGILWPALGEEFVASLESDEAPVDGAQGSETAVRKLTRVPSRWVLPQVPQLKPWRASDMVLPVDNERQADWAGDSARHVGTTVHRVLQQIATEGPDPWMGRWMDGLDDYLARMLSNLGVVPDELSVSTSRAGKAIRNCLTDERGRWILKNHANGRAELPLSAWVDGRVRNVILDRTFIDDEGVRWIVDYKTAQHEVGTIEAFMDSQLEQYRGQLEMYARVMHRMETTPIRLALYFPLLPGWCEWSYVSSSVDGAAET